MFRIFLLIILSLLTNGVMHAQESYFSKAWADIEVLQNDGELKSLKPKVEEILAKAKREKSFPDEYRAWIYLARIDLITNDDFETGYNLYRELTNLVKKAKGAEKAILASFAATSLQAYYENNRYEIQQRTDLAEEKSSDYRTWSNKAFRDEIHRLFSIAREERIPKAQQEVERWQRILFQHDESGKTYAYKWRPTLQDLLHYRSIGFYTYNAPGENSFPNATPKDLWELNQTLHLENKNLTAYLHSLHMQIESLYNEGEEKLSALKQLVKIYPKNEYNAEVWFSIAKLYHGNSLAEEGNTSQPKKAHDILNKIEEEFPNSYATSFNVPGLKKMIEKKDLNIQLDSYNSPQSPILLGVKHTNLNEAYYKIVRLKVDQQPFALNWDFDKEEQRNVNELTRKSYVVRSGTIDFRNFTDFKSHTTLKNLEGLPTGTYMLVMSDNSEFNVEESKVFRYNLFAVSDYALAAQSGRILVSNRETGKPIANKEFQYRYRVYRSQDYSTVDVKTNNKGIAEVGGYGDYSYYNANIKIEGEDVWFTTNIVNRDYDNDYFDDDVRFKLFTDRAIYRPGQTVHFKVLAFAADARNSFRVKKGIKDKLRLSDSNGNEVQEIEFETNEMGSFSGTMQLPSNGLTGIFFFDMDYNSLVSSNSNIRVEEYKRPKFTVSFKNPTQQFALNDSVKINGSAMAFAGNPITNATVIYRVERRAFYPYRFYYYGYRPSSYYNAASVQVGEGETKTDSQGNFTIPFLAAVPENPNKNEKRNFEYNLVALVTDANGETHEQEYNLRLGDVNLILSSDIKDQMYRQEWKEIQVNATDLNRNPIEANGTITLTEVPSQEQIIMNKTWAAEYLDWNEEEFYTLFPHIQYPIKKEQPPLGRTVWTSRFNTKKEQQINVPSRIKQLKRGRYLMVIESTVNGDTVRYEKDFVLNDVLNRTPVEKVYFKAALVPSKLEVGGEVKVQFATSSKDALVYLQFTNEKGEQWEKEITLNNEIHTLSIPLKLANEGYNRVDYFFQKWGENRSGSFPFYVKRGTKELEILTQTFRDKIEPGAKEKWKFTVKGEEKEGVLAEVLATMYDASLDEFVSHNITYSPYSNPYLNIGFWSGIRAYRSSSQSFPGLQDTFFFRAIAPTYASLNTYDFSLEESRIRNLDYEGERLSLNAVEEVVGDSDKGVMLNSSKGEASGIAVRGLSSVSGGNNPIYVINGEVASHNEFKALAKSQIEKVTMLAGEQATALYGEAAANGVIVVTTKEEALRQQELLNVKARKNLIETAFFYPHIRTNAQGDFVVEFEAPESLTEWKFMAFAHTSDMRLADITKTTRTQKELMVVPNPPRFLREGDELFLKAKVVNLSDEERKPNVQLFLFDPFTEKAVDIDFAQLQSTQSLTLKSKASGIAQWKIKVPKGLGAVKYTIVAKSGSFSDGESSVLPILTNRMLVTESMAMQAKGGETNRYSFDKLKNNASKTLDNHSYTLEVLPNPVWHAVFALPYLQEYPHECSEQLFSRIFGNAVASHLLNKNPKVKAVFDDWNRKDQFTSPLERNQELKNILLTESPWVRQAQSKKEQQKRIALLFDLNNLNQNLKQSLDKLEQRQSSNGGFAWFPGGNESFHVSNYILAGIGRMKKMGVSMLDLEQLTEIEEGLTRFVDREMENHWKKSTRKRSPVRFSVNHALHYLYARSYSRNQIKNKALKPIIINQLLDSLYMLRNSSNLNMQAKLALTFQRMGKTSWAKQMLNRTKEYAVESKEKGMYWKENVVGWNWYQAPIETQALLIEGFDEVLSDMDAVEEMKIWLLHSKKNNRWSSTKSTTSAVYALMTHGANYIDAPTDDLTVTVGNKKVEAAQKQAGSGYFKKSWKANEVEPNLGNIELSKKSPGIGFAAAYWQYWEDLDNITQANSVVQMKKQLFVKRTKKKGEELEAITAETPIKVGEKVVVRLEVKADREMEFIHLKDLRASGFEPVNVLSTYKWQGGLGYYESTKDAATHFFISNMPKGVYVFEYELIANNAGNFSNGITQFMSMYAPELSAHSKGIRVQIER